MTKPTTGYGSRRWLLRTAGAAATSILMGAEGRRDPDRVRIMEFDEAGKRKGISEVEKIRRSPAEWAALLTREQFAVTRQAGTERAFTGKYHAFHGDGIYRCVCCQTALFDSHTKFESGTGWPSFWAPIARENVALRSDRSVGMERTEALCARCDGHLGHVFTDGPAPTYKRYCMNSASLAFSARRR